MVDDLENQLNGLFLVSLADQLLKISMFRVSGL